MSQSLSLQVCHGLENREEAEDRGTVVWMLFDASEELPGSLQGIASRHPPNN